jgi:hypothetical protein
MFRQALLTALVVAAVLASAAGADTRRSYALGKPWGGRLSNGVQLPRDGVDHFTWDPVLKQSPNRGWRLWGTDRLVRTVLAVLADYHAAYPDAPRVGVGDLAGRAAATSARASAGSGTPRTRTGSMSTSTTRAATARSARPGESPRSTGRSPRRWSTASSGRTP